MTHEALELLQEVLKLPVRSRAALIARVIERLDEPADDDAEAAWQREIDRRARELADGTVTPVSWHEARRQIFEE